MSFTVGDRVVTKNSRGQKQIVRKIVEEGSHSFRFADSVDCYRLESVTGARPGHKEWMAKGYVNREYELA